MNLFDNINKLFADELKASLEPGASVSLAVPRFSIDAWQALKKELAGIRSARLLFTDPAFLPDADFADKARIERERALYGGTDGGVINALQQKALARECAEWLRKKASLRAPAKGAGLQGFMHLAAKAEECVYLPLSGFTGAELGLAKGHGMVNIVNRLEAPHCGAYLQLFNELWRDGALHDVKDALLGRLELMYRENAPEYIYFLALNAIFQSFLEDSDFLPNEASGYRESAIWQKLYDFQKDAALGIIGKLEKFNGCILADSVGLGKTFTALAVIKYYESRNRNVLVLCPKKLAGNWIMYQANYVNNPLARDRLRYNVLHHTDLSRGHGMANGLDLALLNWSNYDLVVIDESHNFRNGGQTGPDGMRENRYLRLLNRVIRGGVKTRVLMLSATPVNNRFQDLRSQLTLACEGDESQWDGKLGTDKKIADIFKNAQKAFNAWNRMPQERRTVNALLGMLDSGFFNILDSVSIARSRRHIEKHYNIEALGPFPERLSPLSRRPRLSDIAGLDYSLLFNKLDRLNLEIYAPSLHIFASRREKYENEKGNLTRTGRESGLRRLMATNLLKRLESSVHSFLLTLRKIIRLIEEALAAIEAFEKNREAAGIAPDADSEDFDLDDQNIDLLALRGKSPISLADMDYVSWRASVLADLAILRELESAVSQIGPETDSKLQSLLELIDLKLARPLNGGNRKILVFTAFADTAAYLYGQLAPHVLQKHGLHCAMISGAGSAKSTVPGLRPDFNDILTNFAPLARERASQGKQAEHDVDLLIATDCLSEGQNLQDCDFVVNYDIHWNPVRIIQRFGRVDRIGSPNRRIQMANFWPDIALDDYIRLKERVEARMKATVLASTGDDDLLDESEKGDLAYRKRQLLQLRQGSLDLEDLAGGISITDLGLNEFRQDLLALSKKYDNPDLAPNGLYALVGEAPGCPPGAIFILRKRDAEKAHASEAWLHPFYLAYVDMEGKPVLNGALEHLRALRLLCRGASLPDMALCKSFSAETRDGKRMEEYLHLLGRALEAIIGVKEQSDVDSLFRPGGTSALKNSIHGLDEFELLCFIVVRPANA